VRANEGMFQAKRAGYHLFLPFILSLAINAGLFAVAPLFLEQTAMPDLSPHALLNLLMPVRPETTPPEPEPERDMPDEMPELELAPMEPELSTEPPDVPEISPLELDMPESDIPVVETSPPDVPPIKTLSTAVAPMQLEVNPSMAEAPMRRVAPPKPAPRPAPRTVARPRSDKSSVKRRGYEIGQVDVGPRAMGQSLPPYPRRARRMGVEGWVKVRFLVDKDGRVQHLKVIKESPAGIFYKTVMRTVPRWRFRPAKKGGEPVDVWVEQTIRFKMERW